MMRALSGKNHGRWKGGIRMQKGYRYIYKPGHRLAILDGYVAEHRLVMARQIKNKAQVVHHKDGNKLNNKKSNLVVFANNSLHRAFHSKTEKRDKNGKFRGK